MNKVENKKGKKRPLGQTQSAKPGQKQENAFKKDFKKPKLSVSPQNGDSKAENKAKPFKVDKQKQQKNTKQNNTMPSQMKEKIAQSKEVSLKTKEKMVDGAKKKVSQEKQQQQSPGKKSPKKELTLDQIQQKIKEIESRESLSKTAAKKLYTYKKLQSRMTGGKQSEKSVIGKKNTQKSNENAQAKKQKVNDKEKAKPKPALEIKHETEEDDDDDDDIDEEEDDSESELSEDSGEEEEEVEEEEAEDEEDSEEDESYEKETTENKSYEEEEMTEEVDEEESENEDDESEDESDDDDEVSDEMDDEDDIEADTDDESFETKGVQSAKKKEEPLKKYHYALFVRNLPKE